MADQLGELHKLVPKMTDAIARLEEFERRLIRVEGRVDQIRQSCTAADCPNRIASAR
jgi:hypothetical protein